MNKYLYIGLILIAAYIAYILIVRLSKSSSTEEKDESSSVIDNSVDLSDDNELVAVITAAILAYDDEDLKNGFIIKKIVRNSDNLYPWSRAGLQESFESRKITVRN
ncbi:MAG: OadG family protein [Clostridiaceae bacterium]